MKKPKKNCNNCKWLDNRYHYWCAKRMDRYGPVRIKELQMFEKLKEASYREKAKRCCDLKEVNDG